MKCHALFANTMVTTLVAKLLKGLDMVLHIPRGGIFLIKKSSVMSMQRSGQEGRSHSPSQVLIGT